MLEALAILVRDLSKRSKFYMPHKNSADTPQAKQETPAFCFEDFFTPKGRHEHHRLLDDVAGEASAFNKQWLAPV